jgi:hypothetical protein
MADQTKSTAGAHATLVNQKYALDAAASGPKDRYLALIRLLAKLIVEDYLRDQEQRARVHAANEAEQKGE